MENNVVSGNPARPEVNYRTKEAMCDYLGYMGDYSVSYADNVRPLEQKAYAVLFGKALNHFSEELASNDMFTAKHCQYVYSTIKKHEPEYMRWLESRCLEPWKKKYRDKALAAEEARSSGMDEREGVLARPGVETGSEVLREFDNKGMTNAEVPRDAFSAFMETGKLRDDFEVKKSRDGEKDMSVVIGDAEVSKGRDEHGRV